MHSQPELMRGLLADMNECGNIGELACVLFQSLHEIDEEASTMLDGVPTGLNWYGGHARPDQKKPQTEPYWTRRLAEILSARGLPTTRKERYPVDGASRGRCDLVVTLDGDRRLWIEIKGAWREWWRRTGSLGIYRAYLLHPLVPGLAPKSHTVPLDLQKLSRLSTNHADHVALLLVGFDSVESPMDDDVSELMRLAGLNLMPWTTVSTGWPDQRRLGERVRCWCFHRAVTVAPETV